MGNSDACTQGEQRTIRVKTWEEFRKLVIENRPKSLVYIVARSIPASELTSLKLILPLVGKQYIFVDSAKDGKLRQTGIPLRTGTKRSRFIDDDDVRAFLKAQFPHFDLQIVSYWTI